MQFQSTRDSALRVSSSEAIVRGLAPKSGLFVPESFPKADLENWKSLPYPALAEQVLKGFLTDYSADFLHSATAATYGEAFGGKAGETGQGQRRRLRAGTVAWPHLRVQGLRPAADAQTAGRSQEEPGPHRDHPHFGCNFRRYRQGRLGGLCGSATASRSRCFIPNAGTSEIQHLQMATQKGDNVQVYAVRGQLRRRSDRRKAVSLPTTVRCRRAGSAATSACPAPTPSTGAAWCRRLSTTSTPTSAWPSRALSHGASLLTSACPPATLATSWPVTTPNRWVCPWVS